MTEACLAGCCLRVLGDSASTVSLASYVVVFVNCIFIRLFSVHASGRGVCVPHMCEENRTTHSS